MVANFNHLKTGQTRQNFKLTLIVLYIKIYTLYFRLAKQKLGLPTFSAKFFPKFNDAFTDALTNAFVNALRFVLCLKVGPVLPFGIQTKTEFD